jgi:hypothetical protein
VDTLFFVLRWTQCVYHKKCIGTRYVELDFFPPVGSAGNVVHSGASGPRNSDTLFFTLGWDRYGFGKKCTGTHYAELMFLHPVGSVAHTVHFHASGTRYAELVFLQSMGSMGHVVHSTTSTRETSCTIFHARVCPVLFP